MKNLLIGLLIAGIGGSIIAYSHYLVDFLGNISWAERKLGGTKNLYILFGMFLVFLGFLFIFGVFDASDVGNATNQGFGS